MLEHAYQISAAISLPEIHLLAWAYAAQARAPDSYYYSPS